MHYSVAPLVEDRWGAECFCPPCHVYGQRGTGRSVPSAPPAMSVAGGVQDAQSHLPPPLAMSTAGGVRDVQSHLPPGLSGFGVLRDVHSRHQPMGRLGTGR